MAEIENDPSWQSKLSTLRERVEYAFNNALFSDVQFTVEGSNGDKVTVTANKHILTVSSPVFEKMFHGKLAEKGPTIHLPDCTKDGLQEMLRYMHSDVVYLTGSNVMEVLYLAEKYMMPLLRDQCYEYLASELTPADVFTVLTQAQQSNNTRAEELCWNVVDFKTHQAVTSKAFLNISRDLLQQVLERETLHTDEVNLFRAVNSWASNNIEEESKKEDGEAKRSVLGDEIVRLIRFPVMSQKEFADDVLVSNLLRGSEVTEVIQIFSSISPSQISFMGVKRKGQWNEQWTENRFDAVDTQHCGDQQNHIIVFEVNKPIFLAGVRLFDIQGDANKAISAKLSIHKTRFKTELFETKVGLDFKQNIDGLYFGHSVMVIPPILLLSNEKYSITTGITTQLKHKIQNSDTFTTTKPPLSFGGVQSRPSGLPSFATVSRPSLLTLGQPVHFGDVKGKKPSQACALSKFTAYLGSGGKKVIQCDDIKITFMNSEEESNPGTTVDYGQFPSLLLKRKLLLNKEESGMPVKNVGFKFSPPGQGTGLFGQALQATPSAFVGAKPVFTDLESESP